MLYVLYFVYGYFRCWWYNTYNSYNTHNTYKNLVHLCSFIFALFSFTKTPLIYPSLLLSNYLVFRLAGRIGGENWRGGRGEDEE